MVRGAEGHLPIWSSRATPVATRGDFPPEFHALNRYENWVIRTTKAIERALLTNISFYDERTLVTEGGEM